MSTFAFGTYRISEENLLHIEALKMAIESGVRIIETSPAYTDGSAQRAIARAMAFFDDTIRQEIKIVVSAVYSEREEKSIEEYLEDVFATSLKNLQLNGFETFLIDAECRELYRAFVFLQKAVNAGIIQKYGVCGAVEADMQLYDDLAERAAKSAGSKEASFKAVDLSINLLEQQNIVVAEAAKKAGKEVMVCRALDAIKDGLHFRLASYSEPQEYYHTLNELLELCDNTTLKPLYNLIEQLDINRHKFGWIGEYEHFLMAEILPHIKKSVENLPQDLRETLLEYLERFLRAYREMVAYESSLMTKTALKEQLRGCEDEKMQVCALRFLETLTSIDIIVVGMRKPSYVQEVMALKA